MFTKVEAQSNGDGQLALSGLSFSAGSVLEVTVLEQPRGELFPNLLPIVSKKQVVSESLESSTLYRYDDPFGPAVLMEDWNALL